MGLCTRQDVEGRMGLSFSASSFPTASFVDTLIDICSARIDKYCARSSWPSPVPGDVKSVCMEMVNNFVERVQTDKRYRGLTDAARGEVETAVSTREIFTDENKKWLKPWVLKRGDKTPFITKVEPTNL